MGEFEFDAVTECEYCAGAGTVDGDPVQDWNGPYYPTLICSGCGGTGHVTIHVGPIDMEDLAKISGEEDSDLYRTFALQGGNP